MIMLGHRDKIKVMLFHRKPLAFASYEMLVRNLKVIELFALGSSTSYNQGYMKGNQCSGKSNTAYSSRKMLFQYMQ